MITMHQIFWHDESGQTMVEYGVIIALISVAVIAVLVLLSPQIANVFNMANTELAGVQNPTP